MKLASPKTYRVIRYVLEHPSFRQVEASEATGVSIGLVNRVTNWLVTHRYVGNAPKGYRVAAPAALAESLSFFRQMSQLKLASFNVALTEEQLKSILISTKSVLCLTSALQKYDDYFRDPSIHAYANQDAEKEFRKLPPGRTSITLYKDDLNQQDDFETDEKKKSGLRFTKPTRTIIDVLCSERAYAAEKLINRTWGSMQ